MASNPAGGTASFAFIESLGDACLVLSTDGTVAAANAGARRLYGEDRLLAGIDFESLTGEQDRGLVAREIAACNGTARSFTASQRRSDGSEFLGSLSLKRADITAGEPPVVVLVRELEDRLARCESDLELHDLMLKVVGDGVIAHTVDGELLYANTAAEHQWSLSAGEMSSRGPFGWVPAEQRAHLAERTARILSEGEARFESGSVQPDGTVLHTEVFARRADTSSGPIIVSTIRDISERMQTEEMVRYLAYHDMLTGLGNRVHLEQELAHALSTAERYGDVVGLIFIDLDNFKPVNDTYGHAVGDEVLREVANRISAVIRESDVVARLGGDEFVVLFPRLSNAAALDAAVCKLATEISAPIDISGTTVGVSASIGCAVHRTGETAEAFLTRADLDMYRTRDRQGDCR